MIFGDLGGLKLPDICLTGDEKPRKNLAQETCPDWGLYLGPLHDKRACYHLLHSGGPINLIYHLKCTECSAFYIGETHRSLSDCMNGHRFTTMVSNPDLPVAIHAQSHQTPFQECWSVSVIHKLPDSTPDQICRQFETAYQLVLQSQHTPSLNIR